MLEYTHFGPQLPPARMWPSESRHQQLLPTHQATLYCQHQGTYVYVIQTRGEPLSVYVQGLESSSHNAGRQFKTSLKLPERKLASEIGRNIATWEYYIISSFLSIVFFFFFFFFSDFRMIVHTVSSNGRMLTNPMGILYDSRSTS